MAEKTYYPTHPEEVVFCKEHKIDLNKSRMILIFTESGNGDIKAELSVDQ